MSRFAYFYFMKNEPDAIRRVAPEHAAYWRTQNLDVANDPFGLADLLADTWIKEWQPE